MPVTSKRQAQLKKTQAASQNAKRAQKNIRERAEHEANIRERAAAEHAGHADRADPDCYECLFPRAVHFSLRDVEWEWYEPARSGPYAAYVGICESPAGSITAYGAQLHLEHPDWQIATAIGKRVNVGDR